MSGWSESAVREWCEWRGRQRQEGTMQRKGRWSSDTLLSLSAARWSDAEASAECCERSIPLVSARWMSECCRTLLLSFSRPSSPATATATTHHRSMQATNRSSSLVICSECVCCLFSFSFPSALFAVCAPALLQRSTQQKERATREQHSHTPLAACIVTNTMPFHSAACTAADFKFAPHSLLLSALLV